MTDVGKRLFIGIKISAALQNEINSPAPGTQHFLEKDNGDYLQIVSLGEDKLIGRYVNDGYPATAIADVSRNVCSIVKLITRGRRIEEKEVHIYSSEGIAAVNNDAHPPAGSQILRKIAN